MKKAILILSVLLCFSCSSTVNLSTVNRHVNTEETTVKIDTSEVTVVATHYNYSKKILESALTDKLKAKELPKAKSASNKFKVIRGVKLPEISTRKLDYYYRVSGKKNTSTLEMLVSKGYNNYITPEADADIYANLKSFGKDLEPKLYSVIVAEAAAQKEKELKKAQKKLDKAQKSVDKQTEEADRLKKIGAGK